MKPILYIPDCHLPHEHPRALDFVCRIRDKYKCERVIHAGDLFDHQSTSFHQHNPDLPSAYDELMLAKKKVKAWHREFPDLTITTGNHDSIPARQLEAIGLASTMLKDLNAIYETPGWKWTEELIVPGGRHKLWFRHGWSAKTIANGGDGGYSVCSGHVHTKAQIIWSQFPSHSTFSLMAGCLIRPDHRAFLYNRHDTRRPILGCATIVDGQPHLHRMFI